MQAFAQKYWFEGFAKWSLPFQVGVFLVIATCLALSWLGLNLYWGWAQKSVTRSVPVAPDKSDKSDQWSASPIITDFRAEQSLELISVGGGSDEVYRLRLFSKENAKVAEVSVFRIYEGSFWRLGQADDLYSTKTARADVTGWLQSVRVRQLLAQSDEILCVGLASAKGPRESQEDLSLRRAQRIKELLLASGSFQNKIVHAVPFGQALGPAPRDDFEEQWQRSAIVIGISQLDKTLSREVMYDEILRRVPIKNVDLNNYSRVKALAGRADGVVN